MEIYINTEYIKLNSLLKLAGLIDQGSDIKAFLHGGNIMVNGEPATQRGKKIWPGDKVVFKGAEILVCSEEA